MSQTRTFAKEYRITQHDLVIGPNTLNLSREAVFLGIVSSNGETVKIAYVECYKIFVPRVDEQPLDPEPRHILVKPFGSFTYGEVQTITPSGPKKSFHNYGSAVGFQNSQLAKACLGIVPAVDSISQNLAVFELEPG